jgi:hypothetical protein
MVGLAISYPTPIWPNKPSKGNFSAWDEKNEVRKLQNTILIIDFFIMFEV